MFPLFILQIQLLSYIEVGDNEEEAKKIAEIFSHKFPVITEHLAKNRPFRPYTAWNLQTGYGGCMRCVRCQNINPDLWGTNPKKKGSCGNYNDFSFYVL